MGFAHNFWEHSSIMSANLGGEPKLWGLSQNADPAETEEGNGLKSNS